MTDEKKFLVRECYYDCQVCGKEHVLRARWSKESKSSLEEMTGLDMEEEAMKVVLEHAKISFHAIHPGEEFDPKRFRRR